MLRNRFTFLTIPLLPAVATQDDANLVNTVANLPTTPAQLVLPFFARQQLQQNVIACEIVSPGCFFIPNYPDNPTLKHTLLTLGFLDLITFIDTFTFNEIGVYSYLQQTAVVKGYYE